MQPKLRSRGEIKLTGKHIHLLRREYQENGLGTNDCDAKAQVWLQGSDASMAAEGGPAWLAVCRLINEELAEQACSVSREV